MARMDEQLRQFRQDVLDQQEILRRIARVKAADGDGTAEQYYEAQALALGFVVLMMHKRFDALPSLDPVMPIFLTRDRWGRSTRSPYWPIPRIS
jgi:hypothetical protein